MNNDVVSADFELWLNKLHNLFWNEGYIITGSGNASNELEFLYEDDATPEEVVKLFIS